MIVLLAVCIVPFRSRRFILVIRMLTMGSSENTFQPRRLRGSVGNFRQRLKRLDVRLSISVDFALDRKII